MHTAFQPRLRQASYHKKQMLAKRLARQALARGQRSVPDEVLEAAAFTCMALPSVPEISRANYMAWGVDLALLGELVDEMAAAGEL